MNEWLSQFGSRLLFYYLSGVSCLAINVINYHIHPVDFNVSLDHRYKNYIGWFVSRFHSPETVISAQLGRCID